MIPTMIHYILHIPEQVKYFLNAFERDVGDVGDYDRETMQRYMRILCEHLFNGDKSLDTINKLYDDINATQHDADACIIMLKHTMSAMGGLIEGVGICVDKIDNYDVQVITNSTFVLSVESDVGRWPRYNGEGWELYVNEPCISSEMITEERARWLLARAIEQQPAAQHTMLMPASDDPFERQAWMWAGTREMAIIAAYSSTPKVEIEGHTVTLTYPANDETLIYHSITLN